MRLGCTVTTANRLAPDGSLSAGASSFSVPRAPERWQEWLALGQPFVVERLHSGGYVEVAYTARCERAKDRRATRWYAYKRVAGRLHKLYLGLSRDLTLERLHNISLYTMSSC